MALGDNGGAGLIAGALVLSAAILSWGQPSAPRYQIAASGSGVARLDTDSGEIIACDMSSCRRVEQPDRSKTIGPLTLQIGRRDDDQERQQATAPTNRN